MISEKSLRRETDLGRCLPLSGSPLWGEFKPLGKQFTLVPILAGQSKASDSLARLFCRNRIAISSRRHSRLAFEGFVK